ncbi:MAG: hypothetical protein ACE5FY_06185 [Nitrospiria bacterium]
MKRLFVIGLIVACSLFLFSGEEAQGDQYGRNGSLVIYVDSSKPTYDLAEPIPMTLTLINRTDESLIVNRRFNPIHDLKWEIFHEGFGYVPLKPLPPLALSEEDYIRLEMNEEIGKVIPDLHELLEMPLKVGRYGIRVTYTNEEKPKGKETWTGLIVTNLLWVVVKSGEKV